MTTFFTPVAVSEALWNAPRVMMQMNLNWQANKGNAMQEMIVRTKAESLELAATLKGKQLTSIASDHVERVNKFLKDGGFDIQLRNMGVKDCLYAAAIIEMLGEFNQPGLIGYRLSKIGKPGVRLGKEAGVKTFEYQGQKVIEIPTTSGFSLMITKPTGTVDFKMLEEWKEILKGMKAISGNGIVFPRTIIDSVKIDVSAIRGMYSGSWAIQETALAAKFTLTEKEVMFKAAFAYGAKRAAIKLNNNPESKDYLADHGLQIALAKRGYLLPYAVGLVDPEHLSDEDGEMS